MSGTDYVGGLVGSSGGSVTNSYATGTVRGRNNVGGLIGDLSDSAASNVYATGSVTGTGTSVGGLIGYISNYAPVTAAYATGAVNGGSEVGGLIGTTSDARIDQAYSTGAVNGTSLVGGFIGNNAYGITVTNSYWDVYSSGQRYAVGAGSYSAVSPVTSNPTQFAAPNYAFKSSAYSNLSPVAWVFFDGQTRPFGAWEAVASGGVITNSHQLQLIGRTNGAGLAGSYTLAGNIDLLETGANRSNANNATDLGIAATAAGMWAPTGFVSLGTDGAGLTWNGTGYQLVGQITSGTYGFSGTFDGGGFALSNLLINRAGIGNTGLFGTVSGTLRNIKVGGQVTGGAITGGLVGLLIGGPTLGTAGANDKSPVVSNAISTVNVIGTANTGGLVGSATRRSTITGTASGTVSGTNAVGGLVGNANRATITGTARGAVSGQAYVGGLVGQQFAGSSTGFATGSVTGTNSVGGMIGKLDGTATERGTATATRPAQGGISGPSAPDRNFGQITTNGTGTTVQPNDQ